MGLSSQNKGVQTAVSELNKRPRASLVSPAAWAPAAREAAAIEWGVILTGFQKGIQDVSTANILVHCHVSFFFSSPANDISAEIEFICGASDKTKKKTGFYLSLYPELIHKIL